MKLNKFNLSKEVKLTFDHGELVPFLLQECLPADKFRLKTECFTRVMPLVSPVLHRFNLRTYYFFVPYRLIWTDSEEFFTRGRNQDSTVTVPKIPITNSNKSLAAAGSLADYFGIPPIGAETVSGTHYISQLPFCAYTEIYNEYFRAQEVTDEVAYVKTSVDADTTQITAICTLRKRNYDQDYFTIGKKTAANTAAPNGFAQVQPINVAGTNIYADTARLYNTGSETPDTSGTAIKGESGTGYVENTGLTNLKIKNLNDPLGVDIDDIRKASAIQRWFEKILQVGYRYYDYLRGIWHVTPSDSRLQRPEYLGGSSVPIRISEVLNTSDTANAVQGQMAGHGIGSGETDYINFTCEEHGLLIGLICVIPQASYFQGIPAYFMKFDHLEFANPYLADLGSQEMSTAELYYNWAESQATNDVNFAYKPRYAEYKKNLDSVHGEFRSTLAFWHCARTFSSRPVLNQTFMDCTPKSTIFAVTTGDHYLVQAFHDISVLRALPYFATPRID